MIHLVYSILIFVMDIIVLKILKADYCGLTFTQSCRYAQTGKQLPSFRQLDIVSAFHHIIRRSKIKSRSFSQTSDNLMRSNIV